MLYWHKPAPVVASSLPAGVAEAIGTRLPGAVEIALSNELKSLKNNDTVAKSIAMELHSAYGIRPREEWGLADVLTIVSRLVVTDIHGAGRWHGGTGARIFGSIFDHSAGTNFYGGYTRLRAEGERILGKRDDQYDFTTINGSDTTHRARGERLLGKVCELLKKAAEEQKRDDDERSKFFSMLSPDELIERGAAKAIKLTEQILTSGQDQDKRDALERRLAVLVHKAVEIRLLRRLYKAVVTNATNPHVAGQFTLFLISSVDTGDRPISFAMHFQDDVPEANKQAMFHALKIACGLVPHDVSHHIAALTLDKDRALGERAFDLLATYPEVLAFWAHHLISPDHPEWLNSRVCEELEPEKHPQGVCIHVLSKLVGEQFVDPIRVAAFWKMATVLEHYSGRAAGVRLAKRFLKDPQSERIRNGAAEIIAAAKSWDDD